MASCEHMERQGDETPLPFVYSPLIGHDRVRFRANAVHSRSPEPGAADGGGRITGGRITGGLPGGGLPGLGRMDESSGEVVHWLACSLYAACRKSSTPTVGRGLMEGNCVSLTRILRTAKLSLIQFFSKMRKWADMSNLPPDFRNFRMIGDDLVNSYHLLLCCLDLVFSNASLCSHRELLINPAFTGARLPSKAINREYEVYVLSVGDFDEHFAEKRLKLAEILYFKVLENVMLQETKRHPGKDMSVLLGQDLFHGSLLACCLEVVLFSYSSQRTFPWKEAWSRDSALWSALEEAGFTVPTVEERRLFGDDPPATPSSSGTTAAMPSPAKQLMFGCLGPLTMAPGGPTTLLTRHSLYVSPHKASSCSSPNPYTYRFNRSPSKELSDINRMLQQGCVSRKRAFTMEGEVMMSSACDSPTKRACPEGGGGPDVLLKRLQDV
ncbi:hypothetical protein CRUP_016280, partial [Coryphaenoides rupestris]